MLSAAIGPWRFAGPASGIKLHAPVMASRTSTASPTDQMCGSAVFKLIDTSTATHADFKTAALRDRLPGARPDRAPPHRQAGAGHFSIRPQTRGLTHLLSNHRRRNGIASMLSQFEMQPGRHFQIIICGNASTTVTESPPCRTSCSAISSPM
jgi:hypothetical protein